MLRPVNLVAQQKLENTLTGPMRNEISSLPHKGDHGAAQHRNKRQMETWMRWYHRGELKGLEQPVGKQYSYGNGPEFSSGLEMVQAENRFLRQQLNMLKKYKEIERKWSRRL